MPYVIMKIDNLIMREGMKMRDFADSEFVKELSRTCSNMYAQGWDERNGGNISIMLDEKDVYGFVNPSCVIRKIPTGFSAPELYDKYFLVTGTGKYFKNVENDPAGNLGLIRVAGRNGDVAELLWGFTDGGKFTSELPAHLMSHMIRLKVNEKNRVVMHCHPANLVAMSFVHELDDKAFSHSLWQMCTECIIVFPEGIGVLPWMVCGNNEIGRATAERMKRHRLVLWPMHGIYAAGETLDETYGLIETVEKAAQLYMLTAHLERKNIITDDNLRELAKAFNVNFRENYLD